MDRPNFCRRQAEPHQLLAIHQRPQKAGIELDRKILADIAVKDAAGFTDLVQKANAPWPLKRKSPPKLLQSARPKRPGIFKDPGRFAFGINGQESSINKLLTTERRFSKYGRLKFGYGDLGLHLRPQVTDPRQVWNIADEDHLLRREVVVIIERKSTILAILTLSCR